MNNGIEREAKLVGSFLKKPVFKIFISDDIKKSILDIWFDKNDPLPGLLQYVTYKCYILEFELLFSNFMFEKDQCRYTLKRVGYSENMENVNGENVKEIFESCKKYDKRTCSEIMIEIKKTK